MKFAIGEMTVGDILDRSLKLLFARFGTFYAINLIVLSPALILLLLGPALIEANDPVTASIPGLLVKLLEGILQPIVVAATLHVVAQEFISRKATVGQAMNVAIGRFLPLLGTSILVGLVVALGFCLVIVGAIIFAVWYAFAAQAVVVEGLSGSNAMSRSKKLSEGYFGRVFGVLFLLGLLIFLSGVVTGVLQTVLPNYEVVPRGGIAINWANHVINTVITFLVTILATSFHAIAVTLLYYDLRIRKEGYDLELAARGSDEEPDLDFQS